MAFEEESESLLSKLARNGKYNEAKELLDTIRNDGDGEHVLNIINELNLEGSSALHWACLNGHFDLVELLVRNGARIDLPNSDEGQSPFHWACISGHLRIVNFLTSFYSGCDNNSQDKDKAVADGFGEEFDIIHACNRGYNALHHSVQYNRVGVILYLISNGFPIELRDKAGHNVLHWAAYCGHSQLVRYFIQEGIDINSQDDKGLTALHWAVSRKHKDVIKILGFKGADIKIVNHEMETPMKLGQVKHKDADPKFLRVMNDLLGPRAEKNLSETEKINHSPIFKYIGGGVMPFFSLIMLSFPFFPSALIILVSIFVISRLSAPYWPGFDVSNPFFSWFFTSIIITANTALFLSPIWTWLKVEHYLLLWALEFFVVVQLYSVYKSSYSNPGFLKKNTFSKHSLLNAIENCCKRGSASECDYEINQLVQSICLSCMCVKPQRAKHCKTCDRCVARMDHHCLWVNNCIGYENHKPFMLLIISSLVTVSHFLLLNILYYVSHPFSVLIIFNYSENHLIFCLFLMLIPFDLWLAILNISHYYTIATNVTTNESVNWIRYAYMIDPATMKWKNSYDKGCLSNCQEFACTEKNYYTTFSIEAQIMNPNSTNHIHVHSSSNSSSSSSDGIL